MNMRVPSNIPSNIPSNNYQSTVSSQTARTQKTAGLDAQAPKNVVTNFLAGCQDGIYSEYLAPMMNVFGSNELDKSVPEIGSRGNGTFPRLFAPSKCDRRAEEITYCLPH